jgi:GntR family transcriptional regulator/MocR family aminotransferase
MEPIFDLAIDIPAKGSREMLRSLHRQLRAAIVDGRLQPGLRLLPTRLLARRLGISRNTVLAAYEILLSEGYVVTRIGSGTYVAEELPIIRRSRSPARISPDDRRIAPFWRKHHLPPPLLPTPACRFDLRAGFPDLTRFPFDVWQRLSTKASRTLSKRKIVPEEPQGRSALREAIAKHVSFARAVACGSNDVVVTNGTRQALDLLARILVTPGKTQVAIEDPCLMPVRRAFAGAGARIAPVPVDHEGLVVSLLPRSARVIYVSPSHQFPLGCAMSARRRGALLDFARRRGAVIIEDDYDSEFRLDNKPLDALQTLDRDHTVFYVGTFSKSMFPALRLGYVVTPPWARDALVAAKRFADAHSPVIAQDALATFISEGHLARHIRKMRKVYSGRHAALVEALERYCSDRLRPIPASAGVHLAAEFIRPCETRDVVAAAAAADVSLASLESFAHRKRSPRGLVFGYGAIDLDDIEPAIRRLAGVMRTTM